MGRIQTFRQAFDLSGRQAVILGGLVGFALVMTLGIMTDSLVVVIKHASLQRTVDRGAVAAAFELSRSESPIPAYEIVDRLVRQENSAARFEITTCDALTPNEWNQPQNADLQCVVSQQAFVRVSATLEQQTFFLSLIGIDSLTIYASAVAEIATARLNP